MLNCIGSVLRHKLPMLFIVGADNLRIPSGVLYTPRTEFFYNKYLFVLLEYATLRCVLIAPYYVPLATCASGWRNHHKVSDITGVFQALLDHSLFMLRRDTNVMSVQFHGGSEAGSTCHYNCGIYNKGL